MGLEVYNPTDIRNALFAAEQATVTALGDGNAEYRRGYLAALTTIALAFGLMGIERQPETNTQRAPFLALGR